MTFKEKLLLSSLLCLGLGTGVAQAADAAKAAPVRPTAAQMEAVRACAAAKGVEMPAPPAKGEKPPEPPKDGAGKGPHGPKLTEAQRAIVDACFKEAGLEPPKGPPPHAGKGGPRGQGQDSEMGVPLSNEGASDTAQ